MTEVRVYSPELELQGIIDEFSSLIWIRRYFEPGEFELHCPYSESNRQMLIAENIVQRFNDLRTLEAGVIESITMDADEIVAKGRFMESYLERRLIRGTYTYGDTAENIMRSIVSSMSQIPMLTLGDLKGYTSALSFQISYKNVLSTFKKIAKSTGTGYRIRPDLSERVLYFEVYEGKDRSQDNADKVIFSEKYDNLQNEQWKYNTTDYKTMAYAAQTINQTLMVYPTGSGEGLGLREVKITNSVDTKDMSAAQIQAAMMEEAQASLANKTIAESFSFSTTDEPFTYRHNYDVGDIVLIKHNAWNYSNSLRVTEVEEDYERGGMDTVLTCGTTAPITVDWNAE